MVDSVQAEVARGRWLDRQWYQQLGPPRADLARWVAARAVLPLESFDVLLTDRWPLRGNQ
jgi:hypothetical protein